jgi:hypothetical protein
MQKKLHKFELAALANLCPESAEEVLVIFKQCSGSGIRCFVDPWIRDPGWVKIKIRIRDEHLGSYFREKLLFWFKIIKFIDADPGSWMEKIWIRDPG